MAYGQRVLVEINASKPIHACMHAHSMYVRLEVSSGRLEADYKPSYRLGPSNFRLGLDFNFEPVYISD